MKICLISLEYPPETGYGGIGTYTYNLAHGLTALNHKVTVISKALKKEKIYLDKKVKVYRILDEQPPFRGFTKFMNLITLNYFGAYWHSHSVFKKFKEIVSKEGEFDVIEGPLWGGECLTYTKKLNTPLVIRLQTPIFKSLEIIGKKSNSYIELAEKITLKKATLIAAISKSNKELIVKKYQLDEDKIRHSPLGIKFPSLKKPLFKKKSFKLLYVGRLEKRKGIQELINALPEILRKNNLIKVDIVGNDCYQAPGNIGYFEYFKKIVPPEFQKNVKFHGFLPDDKLQKFYKDCDVFIAPSQYESFGLIFLEAMSYGKPVIGTHVGGIPEIVNNKVGLLIKVNNPKAISGAVLKSFADDKLREKLGNAAFTYVREKFTVTQFAERTIEIYKQAIVKYNE